MALGTQKEHRTENKEQDNESCMEQNGVIRRDMSDLNRKCELHDICEEE